MAKIIIDMAGTGGLMERHQGDLNDSSPSPHLRYIGADNQYADGLWNPFSVYGFTTPANNSYTPVTGTVAAAINSIQYDPFDNILYFSEEGENILKLDGLDDTSLSNFISVDSGHVIKDMQAYEINNFRALLYAVDSGNETDGSYVSFKFLDEDGFAPVFTLDPDLATGGSTVYEFSDASSSTYTGVTFREFAQSFDVDDLESNKIDSAGVKFSRDFASTPSDTTLKFSIQGNKDASTAPYSDRGAWVTSTAYSVNDTTTNDGSTWVCLQAHTASGSNEAGSGGDTENFWSLFYGAPDGVDVTSTTITADLLPEVSSDPAETVIDFGSPTELTSGQKYWLVVEEVGSNMTSSDTIHGYATTNNAVGFYADNMGMGYNDQLGGGFWRSLNPNNKFNNYFYLELRTRQGDNWSSELANGAFDVESGSDSFMHLSGNGLTYWFTGSTVHSIDGSSTGGVLGTINESILLFPSYVTVSDAAETRGRMYIGIQGSERTAADDETDDDKFFSSSNTGIFVWDKRSTVFGGTDFYTTPGAKEIRNVFTTSTGDIAAITVNNSGFTEIRFLSGNQFAPVHTMEKDAYPANRRAIAHVGNFSIWLGANGLWYAFGSVVPGESQALYKIGKVTDLTDYEVPGAIFAGNRNSSNNELAVLFGWKGSGSDYNVSKWYPNGEGTIDTIDQIAAEGNVYTKVFQLPSLTTVRYIRGFHIPGDSEAATVAARIKFYSNMSTTPAWTQDLTYADLKKGWFQKEWNKPNINFMQFEVEWVDTAPIGTNTYRPMYLEIEHGDEGRINS